jgi:hypothetical protein
MQTHTPSWLLGSGILESVMHLFHSQFLLLSGPLVAVNDANIEYVEKVCSGDTLTGLTGQINSWSNPERASIATLSIGGNDVGFSSLLRYCVITPNTGPSGSANRANCVASEKKATDYMLDPGTTGLRYKLKEAYLSILRKSGHDVRSPSLHYTSP